MDHLYQDSISDITGMLCFLDEGESSNIFVLGSN